MMTRIIFAALLLISGLAGALEDATLSYQGRFRPFSIASDLLIQEFTGSLNSINDSSNFVLDLEFNGIQNELNTPLYSLPHASLKKLLGLDVKPSLFSYHTLKTALFDNQETNLIFLLPLIAEVYRETEGKSKKTLNKISNELIVSKIEGKLLVQKVPNSALFKFLKPGAQIESRLEINANEAIRLISLISFFESLDTKQDPYNETVYILTAQGFSNEEIDRALAKEFPFEKRLKLLPNFLLALPSFEGEGLFYPLRALSLDIYNQMKGALEPAPNFTLLSEPLFHALQKAYRAKDKTLLSHLLKESYDELAGKPYKNAVNKTLFYPTGAQIKLEAALSKLPFTGSAIFLYGLGALLLILMPREGWMVLGGAFLLHTLILIARVYILERPPVSNMFETVLYVPWIAVAAALLLRSRIALFSAALISALLLLILKLSGLDGRLENVQAVLDSSYWLTIHVMMIVASYGLFVLAGVLGHIWLVLWKLKKSEKTLDTAGSTLLHSIYIGVGLLVPGTILGGVWAAESWGRFWDWDPKESWAFVSIALYLAWIHAYTFRHIGLFGLSIGSIAGLMAVSFTWYGVNYVLGTGLHTYGFGSGGLTLYFSYLFAESCFLIWFLIEKKKADMLNSANIINLNKINPLESHETRKK